MDQKQKSHEINWLGRSLENYKATGEPLARSKGILQEFLAANTLTKARKILHGSKAKQFVCCRGGCYQCRGGR